MPDRVSRVISFGVYEVDRESGELRKSGRRVPLQDQPFRILTRLLDQPGRLVTRDELRTELWPAETFVDFDQGLNAAVRRLRDALGDTAESPRYIETLPRRGYRFIAPVNAPDSAPVPHRRAMLYIALLASAGLALLAMVFALLVLWWPGSGRAPISGRSMAVLPMADYTGNADQAYLADSITDGLITDLAAIGVPRVISRQSVMRYRRSTESAAQIANDLGVDLLVEGSLSRATTGFVVSVQVIDARTDRHQWAGRYQRLTTGEATITDDIASAIAGHLGLVAPPALAARWAVRRNVSSEARDEYLRGRFYWNKRTYDASRKAAEHLQAAVRLQPDYALAWAGLADLYAVRGPSAFDHGRPTLNGRRADGVDLAREALRLDPSLGEAHAALGKSLMAKWEWRGALNELRLAVQLSPRYATARQWYGTLLARLQLCDEAIAQVKIGAEVRQTRAGDSRDPAARGHAPGLCGGAHASRRRV